MPGPVHSPNKAKEGFNQIKWSSSPSEWWMMKEEWQTIKEEEWQIDEGWMTNDEWRFTSLWLCLSAWCLSDPMVVYFEITVPHMPNLDTTDYEPLFLAFSLALKKSRFFFRIFQHLFMLISAWEVQSFYFITIVIIWYYTLLSNIKNYYFFVLF